MNSEHCVWISNTAYGVKTLRTVLNTAYGLQTLRTDFKHCVWVLNTDYGMKTRAGESKRAAAGWGGDKYALYEHSTTGDLFLVQVALWDTVEDAKEFFDAYVKRTALRYPEFTQRPEDKKASTETTRRWQTREGGILIELRGARVVILEGAPGSVSASDLATHIR